MPKYDGFEFLERNPDLFQSLNEKGIKVIILTTSGNPADIEKSQKNDIIQRYIQKPITEEILLELIRDFG